MRYSQKIPRKYKTSMALSDVVREINQREVKQNETLYIFDWDDTILCTSILEQYEFLISNTDL